MDNRNTLSYEQRYLLGYMEGCRIGRITSFRELLINSINIKAKEQGIVPDKKLIQKINRETDWEFLLDIVYDICKDKLLVKELEINYDEYFFVLNEKKGKKLQLRPFKKGDDHI